MSPSHIAALAAVLASGALINQPASIAAPANDFVDVVDTGIFAKAGPSPEIDRRMLAQPREAVADLRFYSRLDRWRHDESVNDRFDFWRASDSI